MSETQGTRRENIVLSLAMYLTVAAVAGVGIPSLTSAAARWVGGALLLAFAALLSRIPAEDASPRKIHLYLGVQTALVAGLVALQPSLGGIFFIPYFILSALAMGLLQGRGALWIGVFALVTAVGLVVTWGWPGGLTMLPLYVGGNLFFGVFAAALARAEAARRESQALYAELREAHRQLAEYAGRVEELAVAEERNRLAREVHDTLGHRLTVAAVQLEGAQRLLPKDPERAAGIVGTVREQVREALTELRRTVAALRAPLEADLRLLSALKRLAANFEGATDITVHRVLPDESPDLPDAHRLALYRAAQEALTNVQRHADASQVWLVLTVDDGAATLLVGDDGRGFSVGGEETGFGLRGLRERVAQLSGELHVDPRQGGGTQFSFRLPLPERESDG